MRAFGFISRAVVIEAIAVLAIILLAVDGLPMLEGPSRESPAIQVAQSNSTTEDRPSIVRAKLQRVASQLRASANQLVDETLATWFEK